MQWDNTCVTGKEARKVGKRKGSGKQSKSEKRERALLIITTTIIVIIVTNYYYYYLNLRG